MKRFLKIACISVAIILLCGISDIGILALSVSDNAHEKYVHLSIDDCWKAFDQLSDSRVNSIYDVPFFDQLRIWHVKYGAKFVCYLYAENKDYSLQKVPLRFQAEFSDASNWIRLGYHAQSPNIEVTRQLTAEQFAESFKKANQAIDSFAGRESRTSVLRLDYFFAKEEWIPTLQSESIILLGPDSEERLAYNLNAKQSQQLWDEGFLMTSGGGGVPSFRCKIRELRIPSPSFLVVTRNKETPAHYSFYTRMGIIAHAYINSRILA